jgi:hypothetical protein
MRVTTPRAMCIQLASNFTNLANVSKFQPHMLRIQGFENVRATAPCMINGLIVG